MIILLCGLNSYRRLQKRNEIVAEFKKKHPTGLLERFDCAEDGGLEGLRRFSANQTIFASAKFGVVKNFFREAKSTKETKRFLDELARDKDATLLFEEETTIPKSFSFLFDSMPGGQVAHESTEPLTREEYRVFISKEAQARGLAMDESAISMLEGAFGGDMWGLITELDKFSLLGSKKITGKMCAKILAPDKGDFMALIRRLAFGAGKEKLSALECLLGERSDAAKVFHVLSYQKKEHALLFADYDVAVKSGKVDYEEVLLDWVLRGA